MVARDPSWRLPALSGRRARVVLGAYACVATLIFVIIAGSFWFNARDYFGNIPAAAEYGFRTHTNDGVPEIASVSRPGANGLRQQDRFLAINGMRLPDDATEYTIAERLAEDKDGRVTLVTRSTDGAVRTHELERIPNTSETIEADSGWPLWLYIVVGFFSNQLPPLVWFGASLLLAWRRPRDPEAMLLAFAFAILCITPGTAFWLNALVGVPMTLVIIIENLGAGLTMLAIAAFPDGRFPNRLSRIAVVLITLALIMIVATPTGAPNPAVDIVILFAVLTVLGSVRRRYRMSTDQAQRQQIKWAVLGFTTAMLLFLPVLTLTAAGLIPEDGPVPLLLYGIVIQIGWLLIPIGLLVSLLKYRLYDADAAISRSAAYATLTLAVAALFAASAEGLEWAFQAGFGRGAGVLPNAIAAAVAVLAITPLNSRIQKWAEWRFQRDLVKLRRDLPDCIDDLRETSSLDRLLRTILEKVVAGVRAERGAVVIGRDLTATVAVGQEAAQAWLDEARLDRDVEALDCDRLDDMFPMRVPLRVRHGADGNFGWLLLGPRPDDSFYGRDEQEVLAELAGPVSRAVQIVLVREAREAKLDSRLLALEAQIARLKGAPDRTRRARV